MESLVGADMPTDLTGRSFALLDQAERERVGELLRPLAWIDGLIAAAVVAPDDTDELEGGLDWLDMIWNEEKEDEIGRLTLPQSADVVAPMMDHYCHVFNTLCDQPETYRPYLAGFSDPLEAASQWAAGFCGGLSLNLSAWAPLLADDDALPLLVAVFSLVREQDMPEDIRADSPLRALPPRELEHMRRAALEMLPEIVLSLHDHARGLHEDGDFDPDADECFDSDPGKGLDTSEEGLEGSEEPSVRAMPKAGRNDPCPCGSGKKHKKCCLGRAEN